VAFVWFGGQIVCPLGSPTVTRELSVSLCRFVRHTDLEQEQTGLSRGLP
jgi:hypothetical protein